MDKLDEFYYHEALDRSYIIANQINDLLIDHPVILKHKELKEKVEEAYQLILNTYQLIGNVEIEEYPIKIVHQINSNKIK